MKYYRDIKEPPALKFIDKNNITGYLYTKDDVKNYLSFTNTTASSEIKEYPDGVSRCGNDIKYIEFINITSIPSYFMGMSTFNGEIKFSDNVKTIEGYFLYNCTEFNQPIELSNSINNIHNGFLHSAYIFNSPIIFPNNEFSISDYFLYECYGFNQDLNLQNCREIANNFMSGYSSGYSNFSEYNHNINFSNKLKRIGWYFMNYRNKISTDIYFPESIGTLSGYDIRVFLTDIYDFSGIAYINFDPKCFEGGYDLSFSVTNTSYPTYQHGIKISGTYKNDVKSKFSVDPGTGYYRKLVIV